MTQQKLYGVIILLLTFFGCEPGPFPDPPERDAGITDTVDLVRWRPNYICAWKERYFARDFPRADSVIWMPMGSKDKYVKIEEPGTYTLLVYDGGDFSRYRYEVEYGGFDFKLPKAFTPNNDIVNETLEMEPNCFDRVTIRITDPNNDGMVVFESTDLNWKWDGKQNGKQVPQGYYLYNARGWTPNDELVERKGLIHILR